MKMLSILLLTATLAFAGEATPLPPAVVAIDATLQAGVDKANTAYIKAIEAEVKKAQANLEREKATATKAGNLDLAMAIKAKQDALTIESVVTKMAEQARQGANALLGGDTKPNGPLVIVSAKWGVGEKSVDVTKIVSSNVNRSKNCLSFVASHRILGDPAPGLPKTIEITYSLGNGEKVFSATDKGGSGVLVEINAK